MAAYDGVKLTVQENWKNRDFTNVICDSLRKTAEFLSTFDRSCRGRLALLNEKLTSLERTIEFLEARVSKGEITNGNNSVNQGNSTAAGTQEQH